MGFRSLPCFASSSGWAEFQNAPARTQGKGLHSLTATASPMGKKMEGWAGAPAPHGMEEKLSSPPPTLGSDASARLLCTLRRDPWGSEPSRALHRHRGGPNLKMLPLSLRASSPATTSLIYIYR